MKKRSLIMVILMLAIGFFPVGTTASVTITDTTTIPGYTSAATAALASPATVNLNPVPEPATICILGLGALCLIRRNVRK
jgi:hypothetical protein